MVALTLVVTFVLFVIFVIFVLFDNDVILTWCTRRSHMVMLSTHGRSCFGTVNVQLRPHDLGQNAETSETPKSYSHPNRTMSSQVRLMAAKVPSGSSLQGGGAGGAQVLQSLHDLWQNSRTYDPIRIVGIM